jgi:hypothetical protein
MTANMIFNQLDNPSIKTNFEHLIEIRDEIERKVKPHKQ